MSPTTRSSHPTTPAQILRPFTAVMTRSVQDRFPLAVLIGALMIGMGLMVGALWPPLQDTFADLQDQFPDAYDAMLGGVSMGTPVGWANAQMLSLVAPIGAIAVGLSAANAGTAGEEESKTLGVLIATPVRRSTFVVAKTVAMATLVLVVAVFTYFGLFVGNALGGMDLTQAGMIGASVHVAAIGVVFGSLAITVGTATGSRKITTGLTAGLALLAFSAASFLPLSESLANGAKASPWYYFNDSVPLAHGVDMAHVLILLGVSAVLALVGLVIFRKRDLRG